MCGNGEVSMLVLVMDYLKRDQPRAAVVPRCALVSSDYSICTSTF